MKNILFAASEGVPFIKTGGLADVIGSLPKYLNKDEFDVRVILPKYTCMKEELKTGMKYITHFYMDLNWTESSIILSTTSSISRDLHLTETFTRISRNSHSSAVPCFPHFR